MRRFVASAAMVAIILFSAQLAVAGPVVPKEIGANAKWFAHVNFEAIRATKLAQDFKAHCPMYRECHAKAEKLAKKLGMNPMKDVLDLTLYGDSYAPHVGVALVSVKKLDREKMINFLREKHPDYKTSEYGSRLLYSWTHEPFAHHGHFEHEACCEAHEHAAWHEHHEYEAWHEHCAWGEHHEGHEHHVWPWHHHGPKHLTAAFASDTLLVIGTGKARVEAALDVLDGKKPSLAAGAALLKGIPADAIFSARASDISVKDREMIDCPLVSNCKAVSATWTDSRGQILGRYEFSTVSDKTAGEFKTVLDGLVAFGRLRFSHLPAVAKLLDGVKGEVKGPVFTATIAISTSDVEAAFKAGIEHKMECQMEHKVGHKKASAEGPVPHHAERGKSATAKKPATAKK